ncbi:MAG: hypothetical protein VXW65_05260 [Pseudomonadota bacterium]|nr:hypothetical protein [Pseudomonadota bacterium]
MIVFLLTFKIFYRKIDQGQALIVNDMSSTPKVYFTGAMVLPVIHRAEIMKISVITLELNRTGKDGLICRDNLRADISVAFYLRVNETPEDVLKVAKSVGVGRASDRDTVSELFNSKFSDALKTVGKQFDFIQLFEEREGFREQIYEAIGKDLNGYLLEDVAIDYLEQTPKSSLDPNNILDSEGIQRITQITAKHNIETNRLERDQDLEIQRKNVSTREASLELERSQADAEARQQREIDTIRARETSATEQVQQEERAKIEAARIKTEEEVAIAEENKQRQVELAEKARERAIQIEEVRIRQARELEDVNRQRAVEVERISMEKELEGERKEIAEITSQRIAVERSVAEEEENIKDVRNRSDAERKKLVAITAAQASAEESKIKQVKAAEAKFEQSKFEADEVLIRAQAEFDAAEKKSAAEKKQAEGQQALAAAQGLADAQVQEANAQADKAAGLAQAEIKLAMAKAQEETGMADVRVLEGRLHAEADGEEKLGLAKAKAREAMAASDKEAGLAEAEVLQQRLLAEADGEEKLGLAKAKAREAMAASDKEAGLAEALVTEKRLFAEADGEERLGLAKAKAREALLVADANGLLAKLKAYEDLSADARSFEEFRMGLELHEKEILAQLEAQRVVAQENAKVMAAALQNAKFELIGGDSNIFEKFTTGMSYGKAVEGILSTSPHLKATLATVASRIAEAKSGDNAAQ